MLALRPVLPADGALLSALLVSARPWLAHLPAELVELQRQAQERDHRGRAGTAGHAVVEVDGVAVGRVWTAVQDGAVLVLDLTLLPAARGRGTGRAVVERVRRGRPLRVSVALDDGAARAFWSACGLREVGRDEVRVQMATGGARRVDG